MKNNILFILTLLVFQFAFGQSIGEKFILCKIVADYNANQNVNVTNVRTEKATISDKSGAFKISVKVGDILVLSAVNLETKRKTISEEDLKSEMIIIKMADKTTPLKEVTVNENSNINAVSSGVLQKEAKKYTPAERKLKTAGDFKLIDLLGILGGALAVDPILNAINGRTKRLKKEIVAERNEKLLVKLDGYYEEEYYTEVLKIPKEYIKGFQYYLIGDIDFASALNAKNKTMTLFLVKKLASSYNEIIQQEEK